MGRVSKYKKIKACDPFSKKSTKLKSGLITPLSSFGIDSKRRASIKKRERREKRKLKKHTNKNVDFDGFDLPPQEKDDFDLNDPNLTVNRKERRQKLDHGLEQELVMTDVKASNGSELNCLIPKTSKEEAKVARILKLNQPIIDNEKNKSSSTIETRREGESMNAFRKRVDKETREVLLKSQQQTCHKTIRNPEKTIKKKAYLQKRKQMKKNRHRKKVSHTQYLDDYDDGLNDSYQNHVQISDSKVDIVLAEQAERPPVFNILPRGAKKKTLKQKQDNNIGMSEEQKAREQRAMEMMREKVIASYALLKAKRKNEGR